MLLATNPPPFTPPESVTEILYGMPATDPCRLLEKQPSPRRQEWLEQQNAYARACLSAIASCGRIRQCVEELLVAQVFCDLERSAIGTSVWGREKPQSQDTGGSSR